MQRSGFNKSWVGVCVDMCDDKCEHVLKVVFNNQYFTFKASI